MSATRRAPYCDALLKTRKLKLPNASGRIETEFRINQRGRAVTLLPILSVEVARCATASMGRLLKKKIIRVVVLTAHITTLKGNARTFVHFIYLFIDKFSTDVCWLFTNNEVNR
jgi:hypothetical protein